MSYGNPAIQHRSPGLWLGFSIAATLLCCWPLAIPGIVFAAQALEAQGRGDLTRCAERVNRSRVWTLWSIWLVVGLLALGILGGGIVDAIESSP